MSSPNVVVDRIVGALRTYSVWMHADDRLELIVFDHGEGPGAAWARTAQAGDRVRIGRPEGTFVTRPSAYHIFVGEETASVAIGAMVDALGLGAQYRAVIGVDTETERLPIPETQWVFRRGRSAARSIELVEAVKELDLPNTPGTAYIAGEARTIQMVRSHLMHDLGWDRRDVVTKPFWTPGKTGLE